MIGRLHGTLLEKRAPYLLVDVNGVGYEVEAPMSTIYDLPEPGQVVTLITHLAVREDNQTLYGFMSETERHLFRTLIRVSGVGAKLALTILSGISVNGFIQCIEHEDAATLTKLPGIGKKTAERLVIEMRDRLKDWHTETPAGTMITVPGKLATSSPVEDAVSALIALGYKPPEASRMVRLVEQAEDMTSEEIIRQALQASVKK
jgi:Holliday junction DNA helicase RuvA